MKKSLLCCLCVSLLYLFCSRATDDFSLRKIQGFAPVPSLSQIEDVEALDASFSYLGHGAQMFVFGSLDGKTVLKFYRHNRVGHPFAFTLPILPKNLQKKLLATLTKRQNKRLKDFHSYIIASQYLAKETGLVSCHLQPAPCNGPLILYDKIGVRHVLDSSQMQFIVQKRAQPLYPSLEKWIAEGEFEKAKLNLKALIALLKTRCQKGIFDKDPDLKTNFGFTKEGPIQWDIGRFSLDAARADPNIYREDLIRITDDLCQWLEKRAPILSAFIKEEIDRA